MSTHTAVTFGSICRSRRLDLDLTQAAVAAAIGTARGHYGMIETGRVNLSAAMMDHIAEALGIKLALSASAIVVAHRRSPRDATHARCVSACARRLRAAGWMVRREVEIGDGRRHGWIDLVAFDPRTRTLLVIEVKTAIEDIGQLERQVGWYERGVVRAVAETWRPARIGTWVLALASAEVDATLLDHRNAFAEAFPGRASEMRDVLAGSSDTLPQRGIALIDPRSRRRAWLIAARVDGRRTPPPYQDRRSAARLLGG